MGIKPKPPNTPSPNVEEIIFTQPELFDSEVGVLEADPIIAWKIEFIKSEGVDKEIFRKNMFASGEFKKTAGIGSIRYQIEISDDDITYGSGFTMGSSNATFTDAQFINTGALLSVNTKFMRGILFNTQADGVGEWQFLKTFLEFILPHGYTITRLI